MFEECNTLARYNYMSGLSEECYKMRSPSPGRFQVLAGTVGEELEHLAVGRAGAHDLRHARRVQELPEGEEARVVQGLRDQRLQALAQRNLR